MILAQAKTMSCKKRQQIYLKRYQPDDQLRLIHIFIARSCHAYFCFIYPLYMVTHYHAAAGKMLL